MGRNITLDYFKLILSILVVTIHTNIYDVNMLGWLVTDGLARISVPFFFIINGYFLYPVLCKKGSFKKYLLHILIIYLVWGLIYFPLSLNEIRSLKDNLLMVLTTGYAHLWYLVSLIGGSILLYLTKKINSKIVFASVFVLYLCGLFIQYSYLWGMEYFPVSYSRNFLFMGFPFIFMGYYMNKNNLPGKVNSSKFILPLTILFLIFLLLESYHSNILFAVYGKHIDFYFSLIILCPLLFILIMSRGKNTEADGYISKLASSIYFVHMLALAIVRNLFGNDDLFNFPLTIVLSVLMSAGIIAVNKRLKIFL